MTVQPKNTDATEAATYDQFVTPSARCPRARQLLVCTMLYQSIVFPQDNVTDEFEIDAQFATIAGAILLACLQMAGVLDRPAAGPARRPPAQKCGQIRPSLPATVKKVAGGYSLKASGTVEEGQEAEAEGQVPGRRATR